ncbi:MAG: LrgB family protein [Arcobacter sp.]|nr:LrgB family protein [Arcobacter sp.]
MIFEHPLFMTFITLATFKICEYFYSKSGNLPILNPVLITISILITILIFFDISYDKYKEGTSILHMMLAPAIIALAIPLYKNLSQVKSLLLLIIVSVIIAGFGIILSAVLLAQVLNLPISMVHALTTKSITAPIALEIANLYGGSIPLTIIGVFSTGLTGVIIVPFILKLLKVEEEWAQGLTLGVTAHAFGIARALSISPLAAAFATMGMGLMGGFAVFAVPLVLEMIIF